MCVSVKAPSMPPVPEPAPIAPPPVTQNIMKRDWTFPKFKRESNERGGRGYILL